MEPLPGNAFTLLQASIADEAAALIGILWLAYMIPMLCCVFGAHWCRGRKKSTGERRHAYFKRQLSSQIGMGGAEKSSNASEEKSEEKKSSSSEKENAVAVEVVGIGDPAVDAVVDAGQTTFSFCTECGGRLSDGAKFCSNCGGRVEGGTVGSPSLQEEGVEGGTVVQEEGDGGAEMGTEGPRGGVRRDPPQLSPGG